MVEKKKTGRRTIDPETKAKAIAALNSGTKTLDVISKEFGVSVPTLSLWKKNAKNTIKTISKDPAERQVQLLMLELDYLRKKLAIYEK